MYQCLYKEQIAPKHINKRKLGELKKGLSNGKSTLRGYIKLTRRWNIQLPSKYQIPIKTVLFTHLFTMKIAGRISVEIFKLEFDTGCFGPIFTLKATIVAECGGYTTIWLL